MNDKKLISRHWSEIAWDIVAGSPPAGTVPDLADVQDLAERLAAAHAEWQAETSRKGRG